MVKGNIKFILFVLVLFFGMFAIEHNMTKEFSWTPTFSTNDKQPFGCYVFDDVLSASMKGNYSVSTETFYQLNQDSVNRPRAFLVVTDDLFLDSLAYNSIISLLDKGNKVMLVSSSFPNRLTDSLSINHDHTFFDLNDLKSWVGKAQVRKNLYFSDSTFSGKKYSFYPQLFTDFFTGVDRVEPKERVVRFKESFLTEKDYVNPEDAKKSFTKIKIEKKSITSRLTKCPTTVLVRNRERFVLAFSKRVGKGELFLVTNPLLFTNYGMLDKGNAGYIFSLLSYMKGMPLVRLGKENKELVQVTPLRYLLSRPPLKWSLYLSLATLVLFMCFTAKRRQRVIPVIRSPKNTTLDFVKQIGTLYHQEKDYLGLLRKKRILFVQALKKETGIDLNSEKLSMELCLHLSGKTGLDPEKLYKALKKLEMLDYDLEINEKELKEYIDQMNEIITNSNK